MRQHDSRDSIEQVAAEVRGCNRCRLAETRTKAVPGSGDPAAPLVLVAEAPGAREDVTGLPFQGMAGRFLDASLAEIGVDRGAVFVTSTNKCRPPRNRAPRRDEMVACAGYLDRQLALIAPDVVLAMGGTAATRLLDDADNRPVKVTERRGTMGRLPGGAALLVTFHPAAAMRFPDRREPFRSDLRAACVLAGLASEPAVG
jgi:DNA polymerase